MNAKTIREAEAMRRTHNTPPPLEWYENLKLPNTWGLVNKRLAGKKVLDIGCATGWVTYWANKQGADCIATDIFDTYIHPSIPFKIADKENLPFPDNTFDFVITANVLHHGDLIKTVTEAHRVLKHAGEFVSLQEPCINNNVDEEDYLKRRLKHELDMGLDEHRPSLSKYKDVFRVFNRVDFLVNNDPMFVEPSSKDTIQLREGDYFGGIAIRAVK